MPIRPGKEANVSQEPSPFVPSANTEYSEGYKEDLFLLWYEAGRPRGKKLAAMLPKDEHGRIPNLAIVQKWMRDGGWGERANVLYGMEVERVEKLAVERKVQMHERHAEIGKELAELGLEWLETNRITTATEASRIIDLGTRLERENTGGAQALREVAKLSNRNLTEVISALMGRVADEEINVIEAEVVDEE